MIVLRAFQVPSGEYLTCGIPQWGMAAERMTAASGLHWTLRPFDGFQLRLSDDRELTLRFSYDSVENDGDVDRQYYSSLRPGSHSMLLEAYRVVPPLTSQLNKTLDAMCEALGLIRVPLTKTQTQKLRAERTWQRGRGHPEARDAMYKTL